MKRRKRKVNKQPISPNTVCTISLSLISAVLFAVCIGMSYLGNGRAGKPVIGIATAGILLAVIGAVISYDEFRDVEYLSVMKVIGMAFPVIAVALWALLYIYGIFVL